MKAALHLFIFLSCSMIAALSPALAQESPAQIENIRQKVEQLESKVGALKAIQEKISLRQAAIDEELANLKVWIRRNRS